MTEIFRDLKIDVDVDQLNKEVEYILTLTDWSENQIALQYADNKSWKAGIGKSDLLESDEQKYVNYNSALEGTYMLELLQSIPVPVSHARLMRLPPKTCYTTHVDYYTRFHIPLTSKPLQTFMVFPDHEPSIIRMEPGSVYWTNTLELHNFLNGTFEHRTHIVFNNGNDVKDTSSPYLRM